MSEHNGQVVGYARVSAADQSEVRQLEALGVVDRLVSEKVPGESADRAQLQEMLAYVRDGDKVRIQSPDLLARSTTDLLALVEKLRSKGVALRLAKADVLAALTRLGVRVFHLDDLTDGNEPRHPSPRTGRLPMAGPKHYMT